MKRVWIFCLFAVTMLFFISNILSEVIISRNSVTGQTITGETVTGKAVTQDFGIAIQVIRNGPYLILNSPLNQTYSDGNDILLNFTVDYHERVWYNLDDSINTSVTSETSFDLLSGSHTLYLYANDSNGGITQRNVTFFVDTSYTINSPPIGVGGGGGSGGGSSSSSSSKSNLDSTGKSQKKIIVNAENLDVVLKQGQTTKREITITNPTSSLLTINLDIEKISDKIKISESSFGLDEGKSITIILDYLAREDSIPDVYIGNLIIEDSGGNRKELLISLVIKSKDPLFDVNLEIPDKFLLIEGGEEAVGNIKLFEVEQVGRVDVEVEYSIINDKGEVIVSSRETMAVDKQANFIKSILTPKEIKKGPYFYVVKVFFKDQIAVSSQRFEVGTKKYRFIDIILYIILITLILIIIFMMYEIRKIKKHVGLHKKVEVGDLVKLKLIK